MRPVDPCLTMDGNLILNSGRGFPTTLEKAILGGGLALAKLKQMLSHPKNPAFTSSVQHHLLVSSLPISARATYCPTCSPQFTSEEPMTYGADSYNTATIHPKK